jgi:hypothetical protein
MPTFHRCEIIDAEGHVMASDIRVALEESTPAGASKSWYGTITVTHLTTLTAGQTYRIVLDDGRSGTFRVRRNTFAGDANRAVAIDGMEPLQART